MSDAANERVARAPRQVAQVWIETIADDPEAVSAFEVAHRTLEAGAHLVSLRRARLIELEGPLPEARELAERLHDSTRFYNPNKERCYLRVSAAEPPPLAAGEAAALVFDSGDERRTASERWWKRVTGSSIRVREGTAWIAAAAPGREASQVLGELLEVKDARHGLLCNPHAQEFRSGTEIPLGWFTARRATARRVR